MSSNYIPSFTQLLEIDLPAEYPSGYISGFSCMTQHPYDTNTLFIGSGQAPLVFSIKKSSSTQFVQSDTIKFDALVIQNMCCQYPSNSPSALAIYCLTDGRKIGRYYTVDGTNNLTVLPNLARSTPIWMNPKRSELFWIESQIDGLGGTSALRWSFPDLPLQNASSLPFDRIYPGIYFPALVSTAVANAFQTRDTYFSDCYSLFKVDLQTPAITRVAILRDVLTSERSAVLENNDYTKLYVVCPTQQSLGIFDKATRELAYLPLKGPFSGSEWKVCIEATTGLLMILDGSEMKYVDVTTGEFVKTVNQVPYASYGAITTDAAGYTYVGCGLTYQPPTMAIYIYK